jgi:hypothetical protein
MDTLSTALRLTFYDFGSQRADEYIHPQQNKRQVRMYRRLRKIPKLSVCVNQLMELGRREGRECWGGSESVVEYVE